jgi:acyl-CoA hydrolase
MKYADETEVKLAQLVSPDAANFHGNVYGGYVMSRVDDIAYVCASRYAGGPVVTAAVDRVDFHEPIHVGEVLNLVARVESVGRTSMEVGIDIYAEDITTGSVRHTNSCHLTMVAVNDRRPAPVPRLICRTREAKARNIQARMRRERGLKYREERDRFLAQFDSMDDAALDALISDSQMPPSQ